MKSRTLGLIAAAGVAAASIAVVGYFIASGPAAQRTARGSAPSNIAPPDVKDLPRTARGADPDSLMGGKGLFIQVMDRNDPTRIASEIISNSLEPLEAKNYLVDEPRAWIYLKNGRVVHVQSRRGHLYIPDRNREPDSGTLEGDVDIRMFDAPPPGHKIDLAKDEPVLRFRHDRLQFDGTLGEVTAPDSEKPFVINSARTDFEGRGLRLLVNQPLERIDLLRVERDGVLRHRPSADPKTATPGGRGAPGGGDQTPAAKDLVAAASDAPAQRQAVQPAPAQQPTPASGPGTTPAAASASPDAAEPAVETFYHTVITGPVTVTQAQRSIRDAHTLELWTHVVDNKLAPGAIAQSPNESRQDGPGPDGPAGDEPIHSSGLTAPAATSPSSPAAATSVPPTSQPATATAPSPSPTGPTASPRPAKPAEAQPAEPQARPAPFVADDSEVVVTWTGPMETTPLADRPAELKADEIALRFTGTADKPVVGRDEKSDSVVTAETLAYGATSREVTLHAQEAAKLERPGQGHLHAPDIAINLADGLVNVPSRGELVAARRIRDDGDASPRAMRWRDNAQFLFQVRDGSMTEVIRRATMVGGVEGVDRGSSLTGEWLQAWFTEHTDGAGRAKPALQRLLLKDNALAKDAKGGWMRAQSMDVLFAPPAGDEDPSPRSVAASGDVHAERDGATVDCGSLDATLGPDAEGDLTVTLAEARDNVKFARDDGVRAEAEELRADAVAQVVDLMGDHAMVGKDADLVFGQQIRLEQKQRTLEVFGPGRFEHQTFDLGGLPYARADASWTKGMRFNDLAGELDAGGSVVAINEPDPLSVETLRAERVKLKLTPADDADADSLGIEQPGQHAPNGEKRQTPTRAVLTAEATGSDLEHEGGTRAAAELRKYASPQDKANATAPQQLQYLEGSRILVDNTAGTLRTPGPGKMLVIDRRRPEAAPPPGPAAASADPGAPAGFGGDMSRGDALFEWGASMMMDRAAGSCRMEERVKMTHLALADGAVTELECETLTAHVRELEPAPGSPSAAAAGDFNGRLSRTQARGAVYIRSKGKELLADGVDYDADARTVEAWASPRNNVTMFDPGQPVPLTARRLFWDLAADRIEVREASPIVAPR